MHYILVRNTNPQKFEEEINYNIANGYEPVGGVSADTRAFYQAMVAVRPTKETAKTVPKKQAQKRAPKAEPKAPNGKSD